MEGYPEVVVDVYFLLTLAKIKHSAATYCLSLFYKRNIMEARDIDAIVIHCTASAYGRDLHVKDIDREHRERGFNMIGYHYLITLDGKIEKGRPDTMVGAHCNTAGLSGKSYNCHSIGVAYVGGLDRNGKAKDTRTLAQKKALIRLIDELLEKYPNIKEIIGHRDASPDKNGNGEIEPREYIKACPCFDVRSEWPMALCVTDKKR